MGAAEFGTEDVFLTKEKVWFSQNEQDFRFIQVDIQLPDGSFITECFYFMIFKL